MRLFHRTTRNLALTDEGRRFVPHSEALRATLARVEADLGPTVERVKGTLRLTVSATFARLYLAPVLAELRQAHPELEVELVLTDQVIDLVGLGLDAGIRMGPLQDSSLSVVKLSDNCRNLVATPELLARVGMPSHPRELTELPCLTLGGRRRWRFKDSEVQVNGVINSNLGEFVLEGALAGLGFARIATWLSTPWIRKGRLVKVLESYDIPSNGLVAMVTPSKMGRPARVEALLAAIKKHLVPAPWSKESL